ncbi:TPA: SERINC2 protein-like [Bos taurus]|nr:TPA: SERINC2 protein-like [Bos taurus]
MGACLGACSLLSCASCLCGSAPCILCSCCPCSHNSTLSRLFFTVFLFLGVLVCVIMLSPGVESQLYKLPWVCNEGTGSHVVLQGHIDCGSLLGHRAVYRMCFAMAAFFFLFSLLMVCVRSSRDPRAAIQNGFWFFKFLIFVGITVGAFYIPDGSFSNIWFYFGVVGSFIFLLIQLLLLIDFAHSWNQRWLCKAEECDSRAWYAGLFFFTLLFYALSITAVALLFVYYTQPGACYEGKVFIGLNLTLCVCVSIVAILPKIQVRARPVSAQPETRPLVDQGACWVPGQGTWCEKVNTVRALLERQCGGFVPKCGNTAEGAFVGGLLHLGGLFCGMRLEAAPEQLGMQKLL